MKCAVRKQIEKLCNITPRWCYIDKTCGSNISPKQLKWRMKLVTDNVPSTFTLHLIKILVPHVVNVKYCKDKKGIFRSYLAIYFDCRPSQIKNFKNLSKQ